MQRLIVLPYDMEAKKTSLSWVKKFWPYALALVLALLLATFLPRWIPLSASTQEQPRQDTAYWRAGVVEESLAFNVGERQVQVPVLFEKFTIEGFQNLSDLSFPFDGLLLVQLRAGELTTIIDDERVERNVGAFWVVAPGSTMDLQTEDDKVILAVYLIGEEYLGLVPDKPLVSRALRPEGLFEEAATNLFSREAHRIGDPDNPIARVVDFNVGPGKTTTSYAFSGVAAVQVTAGQAQMTIDDDKRDAALGDGFGLSEGQPLVVDNSRSEKPFKFRAFVWQK